jgi:predicted ATPase
MVRAVTGTWDDEHVKALLHFPRFPIRLIQQEPWQSWIGQRGGLKSIYSFIKSYPFTPSQCRILDVVLSNPEAVSDVYASQLNISRATYFYQLRDLAPALAQALNQWEFNPASSPTSPALGPVLQPPIDSLAPLQPNIPIPLTTLVGVESHLQALSQLLLRDDIRLLTLLGIGGIGKTRLAIETARRLTERFGSNVCFVDLAALSSPERVGEVIAQALGLKGLDNAALKTYLRPREFLLVLDNFEHVLAASSQVAELLATAPRLKILITSRAALHIYGEHEYIVPPLPISRVNYGKNLTLWSQSPAVSLFVQRAQAVNSGFVLTNENLEVVGELCLHMEGIPLAIELTAFQTKYFSPQAILVRLSNARHLNFLSQTSNHMPLHQQSMRAMLDWSYRLLSSELQELFAGLAVFTGGCTIGAAETVCAHLVSTISVQAGLTALADQSLLEQCCEADGEPRFRMLGITREYALERLEEQGRANAQRHAHAAFYLNFAEQCTADLKSEAQERAFAMLQNEAANLKAAIQWCIDHHEGELGLRFIISLWNYWRKAGDLRKGSQYAQAILEQTGDLQLALRARVLRLVGWLAQEGRDYTTMSLTFQSSLDLSAALGDSRGVGLALHGLGELACLRGQPDHAYDYIERAIKIFKELDDPKQEAWSLNLMGQIELSQGKLTAAQGYFEQSLGAFRAVGSLGGVSAALVNLGQSLYYRGLGDQAAPLFEECVGINQALNRPRHSGNLMALNYLAEIAAVRGQIRQAHELNDTSLKLSKEAGYTWCIERANFTAGMLSIQNGEMESAAFSFQESLLMQQSHKEIWRALILLESVASHSAIRHHALSAARLFGAAEAQRRTTKVRRMPVYQHEYELSLATLKGQMESDALADAWSSGQELSLDQALAYAWRCLDD